MRKRYRDFSYILCSHRYTNSSTINILHHSGIFVTYTITLHWHTLHTYIHYIATLLSSKAGFKFNIKKTKIMAIQYSHFMPNRRGKSGSSDRFCFLGPKITEDSDWSHEIKKKKKMPAPLKESYDKPWQHIQRHRYRFADKVSYSHAMVFFQ